MKILSQGLYRTKAFLFGAFSLMLLLLSGCMSDLTGSNYDRGEARSMQSVQFGEIVEIEQVKLDGSQSGLGAVAGAATGGVAGSAVGGGKGKSLATIAGVVAGGLLGNYAEKNVTKSNGLNLTIRLDNGSYVSVVQQLEQGNSFRLGDRVKVLSQGRTSRVLLQNFHN